MPVLLSSLLILLWTGLASAAAFHLNLPQLPSPAGFVAAQDVLEITPNQAAQKAQQMNGGGKVLAVDAVAGGYRVKLLKDGEVKIIFVPN